MSDEQRRFGTCWHEAGHAVAGFLNGIPIERIEIMHADGTLVEPDTAGVVRFEGTHLGPKIADIIALIEVHLAGTCAVMVAWAAGMFPDAALFDASEEEDAHELTVDHILATHSASTLAEAAAYDGWREQDDQPDQINARKLAEGFCRSPEEASAMLVWARMRTMAFVQSPKFLYLCERLAGVLLELGTITGAHAEDLLDRWNVLYKIEQEATP